MEREKRVIESAGLFILLFLFFLSPVFSQQLPPASDQQRALVGRIGETEGNVLRFVTDSDDWIAVARGTPVQAEEVFYTDEKGRAEFILPNDTTAAIRGRTQIQLTRIQSDITEVYIATGLARITNKGAPVILKAATPFGYIIAPTQTIFDVHVGDESVEVVCVQGKATFVPPGEAARYEVIAGESSLLSDGRKIYRGDISADAARSLWNEQRDGVEITGREPGAQDKHPFLIGRISEVEGNVLRFVRTGNDWIAAARDTPVRAEEAFYTDEKGRAEFVMPNDTLVRVWVRTPIQLIALKHDLTEVNVACGLVRVANHSRLVTVRAVTPFGCIVASPQTIFDVHVGDESVEVVSRRGNVTFIAQGGTEKYEVSAGGSSLLSDGSQTAFGNPSTDTGWNSWNDQMDGMWNSKLAVKGESVEKLPPELRPDASVLEENGKWETVYDDNLKQERSMWKPTRVRPGWAPFTEGRWLHWDGDQCWVPAEPFGYVTHHYGYWAFIDGNWYWSPPAMSDKLRTEPAADAMVYWYPGRVGWFYSEAEIGWFPLAPFEPYYSVGDWGPGCRVVDATEHGDVAIGGYKYAGQAVVVDLQSFYSINNYTSANIRNANAAALVGDNKFRAKPLATARVPDGLDAAGKIHESNDKTASPKPDRTVTERAKQASAAARAAGYTSGKAIAARAAGISLNTEALKTPSVPEPGTTPFKPTPAPVKHTAIPGQEGTARRTGSPVKSPPVPNAEKFKPGAGTPAAERHKKAPLSAANRTAKPVSARQLEKTHPLNSPAALTGAPGPGRNGGQTKATAARDRQHKIDELKARMQPQRQPQTRRTGGAQGQHIDQRRPVLSPEQQKPPKQQGNQEKQ
jgi:ferric-dicitrate binding protein FerR (iron transport regulator)